MYYLKIFVKSFLSLFAIMRIAGMSTKDPCSIILFLILLYVYAKLHSDHVEGRIIPGDMTLSAILSALFSISTLSAQYHVILGNTASRLFCVSILLLTGAGLLLTYYYLSIWFLQNAAGLNLIGSGYSYAWIPFLTVVICLLCWLPYFLYEYPGVMTPDSINQYAQIIGAYELSNHHSVVHTALMSLFYNIGLSLTNDPHTGLALYTFAQMSFMAFAAGYVIRTLQKANVITPVLIITICFYALMPYHGASVVTIWKDIPFAGCMTLFAAALMRFLLRGSFAASSDAVPKLRISEYFTLLLPYIISGVLLCLLHDNGWYAVAASMPFILFTYRKWLKTMLPVHCIILALVLFVKYPVMQVYEIRQPGCIETLSVPLVQLARVITDNEALSESETAFLHQLMDLEQISSDDQTGIDSDIRNLVKQDGSSYLESHKSTFFKTWFAIGLRYPKTYFDAYVEHTKGYWYPDVNCEIGLADGIYPNEFELTWQPVIKGPVIIKIKELLFKLPDQIPLYGLLWSMGFILWGILVLTALCLRLGNPAGALVCLPFILLSATLCIAAPIESEFRYAYPAFYALPLLIMSPFISDKNGSR